MGINLQQSSATVFPTALPNGTTATKQTPFSADGKVATNSYVDDITVVEFIDDFIGIQGNAAVTTEANLFCDTPWAMQQISGGTQTVNQGTASFANPGILSMTTSAVSGQGLAVWKSNASGGANIIASLGALGSNAGWELHSWFSLSGVATICFRLGVCSSGQALSSPPGDGIWVEFDTANTGNSDTDYTWVTSKATTRSYGTTGSIATDTAFHHVRIRSVVAGTILFSIDGGTEFSTTTNVTSQGLGLFIQVLARTTSARTLNVDKVVYRAITGRT